MPFKPITNYKVSYAKNLETDLNNLFGYKRNSNNNQKTLSYRRLLKKINNLENDMFNGHYKLSKQTQNKLGRNFENVESFLLDTKKSYQKILSELEKKHEQYQDEIKDATPFEKQKIDELYLKNSKELFDKENNSINTYLTDLFKIHKNEIEKYVSNGRYNDKQIRTLNRLWNEVEKNIQRKLNHINYQIKNLPEYNQILKYINIYNPEYNTKKNNNPSKKTISLNGLNAKSIDGLTNNEFNNLKNQIAKINTSNKDIIEKLTAKIEYLSKENEKLRNDITKKKVQDIIDLLSSKTNSSNKKNISKNEIIKNKLEEYKKRIDNISDENYDKEIRRDFDILFNYLKTIDEYVDKNANNLSVDEYNNYKKQINKLFNQIISVKYQDDFIDNISKYVRSYFEDKLKRKLSNNELKQINIYKITDNIFEKAYDNFKYIKNVASGEMTQDMLAKFFKENQLDNILKIKTQTTKPKNELDAFKENIKIYFNKYKKNNQTNLNIDEFAEGVYSLKDKKDNKLFIDSVNDFSLSQEKFDSIIKKIATNESFISIKNNNHKIISYNSFLNEGFFNPFDDDTPKVKKKEKYDISDSKPLFLPNSNEYSEFKLKLKGSNNNFKVYADDDFKKDDIVEICPLIILSRDCLSDDNLKDKVYELDSKKGIYGLVLGYGSLYGNSNTPNLDYGYNKSKNLIYFIAKNDIKKDEELTIDYGDTWWLMNEDIWNNYAPLQDEKDGYDEILDDPNSSFNPANSGQVIYSQNA